MDECGCKSATLATWENRLKSFLIPTADIPMPSSIQLNRNVRAVDEFGPFALSVFSTDTSNRMSPLCENLTALESRFKRICRSRSASPDTRQSIEGSMKTQICKQDRNTKTDTEQYGQRERERERERQAHTSTSGRDENRTAQSTRE